MMLELSSMPKAASKLHPVNENKEELIGCNAKKMRHLGVIFANLCKNSSNRFGPFLKVERRFREINTTTINV